MEDISPNRDAGNRALSKAESPTGEIPTDEDIARAFAAFLQEIQAEFKEK
jgi:hypothetical protein